MGQRRHGHRPRQLLLLFLALALVSAACGGGDEGDAGSFGQEGGESGGESGSGIQLTLIEHQAPRVELLRELLPQFEADMQEQGKDISVELLEGPAPDDQFITKMTLDFNSGNAADVTSSGFPAAVDWANSGFLLEVGDRVEQWPDWERFYERLRDNVTSPEGEVFTIPREASVSQLYYRRDVLEEAGISTEQPADWQELLERMQQSTEATGNPSLVIPAGEAWGGGTFFEGFVHLMLATDSPLYDEEAQQWVVRSPGIREVFDYYESMTDAGVLPVDSLLNPEPWVAIKYEAFQAGELTATTCGTWCWIFDWGPDGAAPIEDLFDNVATWEFPTFAGGETFVTGDTGWVWMIAADSEHPDEAWELVQWLAQGEPMARGLVEIGAAAPRDDLADVEPYASMDFLADAEEALVRARSFVAPAGSNKMVQAVGEATEGIITGEMTGEQASDFLAERATELLGADLVQEL